MVGGALFALIAVAWPCVDLKSSVARSRMRVEPAIVVVGSGLAGHAAALAAAEACRRCRVVMIDKEPRVGGNSLKASSGINAVEPKHGDSIPTFEADTLRSGGGSSQPALVRTLVTESNAALEWLRAAGVDLSSTVQLGGHTCKRTHFPPKEPVGASIIGALAKQVAQEPRIDVQLGTALTGLLAEGGRVTGVATQAGKNGPKQERPAEAVILATGGFAANRDLLRQHAPATAELATTNGAPV